MSSTNDLVPNFMPPLAAMLAQAEQVKGSPLTESEVLRVRDRAPCIMMERAHAAQMAESRGYRDVAPENCWADWHRMRVEMTGNGYLPKIVLCVLGGADLVERSRGILTAEQVEHEATPADERMPRAFHASARGWNSTLHPDDWSAIAEHQQVLYVLSPNFRASDALATSLQFLRLAGKLLAAGATAIKCESSGLAHGAAHWQGLAERVAAEKASELDAGTVETLIDAYLQHPLRDEGDLHTCGLHLLGSPDLIVSLDLLNASYTQPLAVSEGAMLFRAFANYLLGECPAGNFYAGHTFCTQAGAPKFRMQWEPCHGYAEDDFFFNPFGRWRFTGM